ncbi:MAG: DUF1566 domain-containing protein [Bacteroidota bacterium]
MKTIKFLFCLLVVALFVGCKTDATETPAFTLGQKHEGGIIFYIDLTGQHGLIAAPADQSNCASWGCDGKSITGTSPFNGEGHINTALVIKKCNEKNVAAQICNDLLIDGYSDWFLPSRNELNLLYLQKDLVGGFVNNFYWSSTEYDNYSVWAQHFFNGHQDNNSKFPVARVRAVRAF